MFPETILLDFFAVAIYPSDIYSFEFPGLCEWCRQLVQRVVKRSRYQIVGIRCE